ncbi:MAG: hypothetical protein SPE03_14585 [Treponema sp.]|nr:hypothetical protein [Treponema sp.]
MKKNIAKELAALAVLALAFTGCNTAFDGTNANFSEKESEYTEISGAKASFIGDYKRGTIVPSGSIDKNNNKNVIAVTIKSFSKIDLESADKAIHFQKLTNNPTSVYYPIRGTDLPKTRIGVVEGTGTGTGTFETTIAYEVNGTGVTTDKVALFVDAKELKTKGGSAVLALDGNTIRGEESDSYIKYLTANGETAIIGADEGGVDEDFRPTYSPIYLPSDVGGQNYVERKDESLHATGVYRFTIYASNRKNYFQTGADDDWENGLAAKLNDAVVIQYRKPGSRTYEEKKLTWTYRDAASTSPATDPYSANSYTADTTFDEIGTEWRACITYVDGLDAPAWYKDVYGHPGIVYSAGNGVGAKDSFAFGTYTLHKTVPSYIVVDRDDATGGSDKTSSYVPASYIKPEIRSAQKTFFSVTGNDNCFYVSPSNESVRDILDPAAAKDFIVVDANNKKIAADVDVITYSYNDGDARDGKVKGVKITVTDVHYRNSLSGLKVCVGRGTKIRENKMYPSQLEFGQWKDVADDDASGYVQIN